jgi:hypothetical protein
MPAGGRALDLFLFVLLLVLGGGNELVDGVRGLF